MVLEINEGVPFEDMITTVFDGSSELIENMIEIIVSDDAEFSGDLDGDYTLLTVLAGTITVNDTTTVTTTSFVTRTLKTYVGSGGTTQVPAPGTLALFTIGVACLGLTRRRKWLRK